MLSFTFYLQIFFFSEIHCHGFEFVMKFCNVDFRLDKRPNLALKNSILETNMHT